MKFNPNATVRAEAGWMNYKIIFNGQERRVYFRNHNRPYIKLDGQYVAVYFNVSEADAGETACEVSTN